MKKFGIAIHGGAGALPFWGMDKKREREYKSALKRSLEKGYEVLNKKGSAIDAVELAVMMMEDEPLFNAGKGSAINRVGEVEMDSSIMDGKTLGAGACAAVKYVRNPVRLARTIMDHCEHLFLTGDGALEFAEEWNLETMDENYFITEERWEKWEYKRTHLEEPELKDAGTAGAVALDRFGNLAAATSTGGLTNKRKGRIGDSPMIGAGTYADNSTCAVSCTGTGEYIIRTVTAHEISSLIKHRNWNLHDACVHMMEKKLNPLGGDFGLVAIDRHCNIKCVFNTLRMYRAWATSEGEVKVELF